MSKQNNLPVATDQWIDSQGKPTIAFLQFMDATARNVTGPFIEAANDAAAAAAGVPINGLYHNSGGIRVRLT